MIFVAGHLEGKKPMLSIREIDNGAQGRDRTTDTTIFNRMLYQLSYLGTLSPANRVTDLQLIAKDRAGYNTRCSAVQLPLQGNLDKFASP